MDSNRYNFTCTEISAKLSTDLWLFKIRHFFFELQIFWRWDFSGSAKTLRKHVSIILLRSCLHHIENFPWFTTTNNASVNNRSQIHEWDAWHIQFDEKYVIQSSMAETYAHVSSNGKDMFNVLVRCGDKIHLVFS